MYGKRLMMLVCIVLMTAGSLVAALSAGSFVTLVVGRSLQGFAAALIPVGISIMRDELPKKKVGSAIALMSATLGIGGALGLPLGGILFDRFGWQSVFWVSRRRSRHRCRRTARRVRVKGEDPGSIRCAGRDSAVDRAYRSAPGDLQRRQLGLGHEQTILLVVVTAVALAFWVPYSLKVSQPLVDLRTSARRPILLTNIASILVGFALMANMLISTQQLQQPAAASGFGLTAVAAGMAMVPSGLAMVAFAPVSGSMINRLGGRITLMAGAAIMAVAYLARVFYGDTVLAVIIGATVVGIGSAVAYAAMPSLIMANVPITETASANGLNALLRALGTSSASAVIAALLSLVTVTVAGQQLPALAAFQDVFWLAAIASLVCCGVAWFVPKRVRVPVIAEAELLAGGPAAVTQAGENAEIVAQGRVVQAAGQPIAHAVVTALRLSGEPLDWSRADNNGAFSLALPGLGRYLLIVNADSWTPRSEVIDFSDASADHRIQLTERLMLTGRVRSGGLVVPGALVTLSARTGEFLAATRTDEEGRYRLQLPPPGHHILTVLEPDTLQPRSIKIFATTQSAVSDVELSSSRPVTQLT
jgi:MFS family permease